MPPTNTIQALQELARGERTAAALESQLSTVEAKIEELLAQAEREQQDLQQGKEAGSSSSASPDHAESNGSK